MVSGCFCCRLLFSEHSLVCELSWFLTGLDIQTAEKFSNGRKIARIAPIWTKIWQNRSQRWDLSFPKFLGPPGFKKIVFKNFSRELLIEDLSLTNTAYICMALMQQPPWCKPVAMGWMMAGTSCCVAPGTLEISVPSWWIPSGVGLSTSSQSLVTRIISWSFTTVFDLLAAFDW